MDSTHPTSELNPKALLSGADSLAPLKNLESVLPVYLHSLSPGQRAQILSISSPDQNFEERLRELGLISGTVLTLTHRAPFGGALAFEVRGTLIALRVKDAECVRVLPL